MIQRCFPYHQHIQQEWDQAYVSQAAQDIASSIGIASLSIPLSVAPVVVAEAVSDQLAPNLSESGN